MDGETKFWFLFWLYGSQHQSSKLPCFLISYKIFGKFLCRTNFRNQLAWRRCLSHQQYTQMPLQGVQMCINAESSGIKQGQAYFVCALWYLSGTRVKDFCEPKSILSYKMQICVSWNNSIHFRNLQAKVKLLETLCSFPLVFFFLCLSSKHIFLVNLNGWKW